MKENDVEVENNPRTWLVFGMGRMWEEGSHVLFFLRGVSQELQGDRTTYRQTVCSLWCFVEPDMFLAKSVFGPNNTWSFPVNNLNFEE